MAVTIHTSSRFPGLVGKKYTKMTPVMRDWDYESLISRGAAWDEQGHYVARPFEKFFNYEEIINKSTGELTDLGKMLGGYADHPMLCPNLEGPYRVMDKLDGSLGIAFYWNGNWHVKTGGSFESAEALWATEFLRENYKTVGMDRGKTYCFEIIWLNAPQTHPLTHFYDKDELVLIGVIDNGTGREESLKFLLDASRMCGFRLPEMVELKTLNDIYAYAKKLPLDKEGVVVTTASGFKLKIKGFQFLELQRLFHGLDKNFVIDNLVEGVFTQREVVPEELVDIRAFADHLELKYKSAYETLAFKVPLLFTIPDRKDVWANLVNDPYTRPEYRGFVMKCWQAKAVLPKKDFDSYFKTFVKWELKEKE